jgi:hypothetical protein
MCSGGSQGIAAISERIRVCFAVIEPWNMARLPPNWYAT